ncbi:zinc ribbon domain-containing protein [Phage DSL-LC04]|nr:zinc ribbon domain-containing protein [Phage DSL-LC04]
MKRIVEAQELDGVIVPKHEVELLCKECGYDIDESELEADTCADCGADLDLQQNVSIHTTTIPAAGGGVM